MVMIRFLFNGVLERLEQEYKNPDVWMTYGRFVVIPAGEFWSLCWGYPEEVIRERALDNVAMCHPI